MNAFDIPKRTHGPIPYATVVRLVGNYLDYPVSGEIKQHCYSAFTNFLIVDGVFCLNYENVVKNAKDKSSVVKLSSEQVLCLLQYHRLPWHRSFIFTENDFWYENEWSDHFHCTRHEFRKFACAGKRRIELIINGKKYDVTNESAKAVGLRSVTDFKKIIKIHGYIFGTKEIKKLLRNSARRMKAKKRKL